MSKSRERAERLARSVADFDFEFNGDAMDLCFGGDGDNGEMLIEALIFAIEKEATQGAARAALREAEQ